MLNELYVMQQGLERIDKLAPIKHNDIKSPGMGTTFRVVLGDDGTVCDVELIVKEQIKDIWSIANGNKNQFPAIKLTFPFMPDAHQEYLEWKNNNKSPKEQAYRQFLNRKIALSELSFSGITCWPSYRAAIMEKTEQLEDGFKDENFFHIFKRYRKSENNGIAILLQIYEILKKKIDTFDVKSLSATCDVCTGQAPPDTFFREFS